MINYSNSIFTWIFFIEFLIKIISIGFVLSKTSYLRDALNILDFIIVISGILEFLLDVTRTDQSNNEYNEAGFLKILRMLRITRPLRSIRALPTMRKLVRALINSLPQLINVLIILFFIILLFGILGLQQFNRTIYNRCRTTPKPLNATYWPKSEDYI